MRPLSRSENPSGEMISMHIIAEVAAFARIGTHLPSITRKAGIGLANVP
jgi:hypothetical protein